MRIGPDTTSTTLTYLFWELARHAEWQTRLRSEVSTGIDWTDGLPSFKDISELPVLDALINEALRLHPAAPSSLPRETPAGGRTLNGVYIPEKVSEHHKTTLLVFGSNHFMSRPLFRCSATPHNVILECFQIPNHSCHNVGSNLMQ